MRRTWRDAWWEASVVALAANSLMFGVIAMGNGHPVGALATGFVPALGLVLALAVRSRSRTIATLLLVACSVAAASWWWMLYPAVLAALVIIGGFTTGKMGADRCGSPAHRLHA